MISHHPDRHFSTAEESQVCWEAFGKQLCTTDGELDLEKIQNEMHDYHGMLEQVPLVYDAVTGGRISEPNTMAFEVIAQAEERTEEAVRAIVEPLEDFKKRVRSANDTSQPINPGELNVLYSETFRAGFLAGQKHLLEELDREVTW